MWGWRGDERRGEERRGEERRGEERSGEEKRREEKRREEKRGEERRGEELDKLTQSGSASLTFPLVAHSMGTPRLQHDWSGMKSPLIGEEGQKRRTIRLF